MGTLQDLPSGKKFTAASWQRKLKETTKYGQLSSLRDNQEVINDIAKKREGAIRSGSYDSSRRKSDYQEILKTDGNLNSKDKGYVRGILDHWGSRPEAIAKKDIGSGLDLKKGPGKAVSHRVNDFSQDDLAPPLDDAPQSKNTPYGYSSGSSSSLDNYFSNSASSSSGGSKPVSSYRPPKLLR